MENSGLDTIFLYHIIILKIHPNKAVSSLSRKMPWERIWILYYLIKGELLYLCSRKLLGIRAIRAGADKFYYHILVPLSG